MSKKIAVLVTDLFEDVEYTDPAKAFEEEGHTLTKIDVKTGEVTGKQGETTLTIDKAIADVTPEDFDALFLPGGFSPDILRADDQVVAFTKSFMDEGKPVMAICHGPQLLINAETLKGRDINWFQINCY